MTNNAQDRATGALIGLAVGDAVGTTLEFAQRDSRPPLTDMVGGGPFGLAPGQWTDDTAMALCLTDQVASSVYVLHSLEAALGSVARADRVMEAILLAANLVNDADTSAAVTGQLAGTQFCISVFARH